MPTQRRRHLVITSFAGLALIGALLVPSAALAGKNKDKGKGGHAKIERLCEQIACTDAQVKDIGQIFEQLRADIKPDREAIRELRQQLASEWQSDRPDERKLASIADKIAAHERNAADRQMEAMLELHGLLTAEQRALVADKLMKAKGDHHKRGKPV